MFISFKNIHQTNPLFKDYIYDYSKTEAFYNGSHHSENDIRRIITNRMAANPDPISILTDTLHRQNQSFGCTDLTLQNIRRLNHPDTRAVVTGQQMGLFTGPAYTIYKALGAVKWCREFERRYPDFKFIPVFWMELEDHDFEEVRHTFIIDKENKPVRLAYEGVDPLNARKNPIYKILLTDEIERTIKNLSDQSMPTEFTTAVMDLLTQTHRAGCPWPTAFGKLLTRLLGHYGIILIDPSDPALKALVRPVFRKAMEDSGTIHNLYLENNHALIRKNYPVQIDTVPTTLFVYNPKPDDHQPHKRKIVPDEVRTHSATLTALLESHPEQFIPNVMLRPIVQDFLLPTTAYIAGPSEIAYFAQLKPLYRHFNITMPLIIPRPFVTILEKKTERIMEKYDLTFEDLFNRPKQIADNVIRRLTPESAVDLLDIKWSVIEKEILSVEPALSVVDASLKGVLQTTVTKMQAIYQTLKHKTDSMEKRRHDATIRQINNCIDAVYPTLDFQERKINILYYLNKYNFSFLDYIYDQIAINRHDHQIINV